MKDTERNLKRELERQREREILGESLRDREEVLGESLRDRERVLRKELKRELKKEEEESCPIGVCSSRLESSFEQVSRPPM